MSQPGTDYVPMPDYPRDSAIPLITVGLGAKGLVLHVHSEWMRPHVTQVLGKVLRDVLFRGRPDIQIKNP